MMKNRTIEVVTENTTDQAVDFIKDEIKENLVEKVIKTIFRVTWNVVKGTFKGVGWLLRVGSVETTKLGYKFEPNHPNSDRSGWVHYDGNGNAT